MTIAIEDTKETYNGDGSTTAFAFDFKTNAVSDLLVTKTDAAGAESALTVNVHYSVVLNGNQNTNPGGTVTYPISGAALASGEKLTAQRAAPMTQPTAFTLGVYPATLEAKLDNVTMFAQQLREEVQRSLRAAVSDNAPVMLLGTAAQRANKFLAFDANGDVAPAVALGVSPLTQDIIGETLYPRTAAEIATGVTPVDYAYEPYKALRQGADDTGVVAANTAVTQALTVLYDQGANHTEAAQIGGVLRFKTGVYRLTSTITIDKDGVVIEGDPGGGTVIYIDGAFPAFTVDNGTLQKSYGVTFRNIRFRSSITDRSAGSAAIKFVAAENFTVENCTFHLQTKYGVWMVDCITGRIINNQFDSGDWQNEGIDYAIYGESSNDAALASGVNATVIAFNSIRYTVTAGLALKGQPISNPPTTLRRECSGVQVIGNHFEHNFGDSIQLLRNRAWFIEGNWFEDGGLDGASGHAFINDIATDDNEASGGSANSGLNAAISIRANTFGGHDNAHADFEHVSLSFTVGAIIEGNYITAGIFGVTADCRGLTVRNNWSSQGEPTLAGTIPTSAFIRDNFNGPTASASNATRWIGSFSERDPRDRPLTLTNTADTTPTIIDSTIGRAKTIIFNHGSAVTVTQLDGALEGDEVTICFANGNTTIGNTSGDNGINLVGGANFVGSAKDILVLRFINSNGFNNRWFEVSRAVI